MNNSQPHRPNAIGQVGAADQYQEAAHRFLADQEKDGQDNNSVARFREEVRRLEQDLSLELVRPRRILVIGGAGFIGSVLVRLLLARGYLVRVLDALLYGNFSSLEEVSANPNFEFIKGDFLNEVALNQALTDATDVVILAALVGDPICKKYPEQAQQINHEGAVGVLDALKSHRVNKIIFTSTCSNYGVFTGEAPATEESPLSPLSIYAETKVAVEKEILSRRGQVDYTPTILRLATAFGLGNRPRFDLTVNQFTRDLAMGKGLLVYDADTWRPYCHIEDISDAILRVLEYPREAVDFQVFNVGGNGQNLSKKQVVEMVQQRVPGAIVEYQVGGVDSRDYRVDFSKIQRVLDFTPQHTAEGLVTELVEALRSGRFADVDDDPSAYGNYEIPIFDAGIAEGRQSRA